jgi:NAD-dependent dihydropyrimidine dehydrogenase PreA subunit
MKIKIDNNKCKNPDICMKCVRVCPAKIFVLKPIIEKSGTYANKVEIKALFKDTCNGCMECVEVCPEQCINVEF